LVPNRSAWRRAAAGSKMSELFWKDFWYYGLLILGPGGLFDQTIGAMAPLAARGMARDARSMAREAQQAYLRKAIG
jgi:hypothetical protein